MQGTRPLMNEEIQRVATCFDGPFAVRNKCLFILGVSTGGRISELLSLTLGDVYQNNKPVSDLLFDRSIVKGKETSRAVPINADGRAAVQEIIWWHHEQYGEPLDVQRPLFPSRNGKGTQPMTRQNAHDILKQAFQKAGLNGKLATHSLRKSYAQRLYEQINDIYPVQEMLGHKDVKTTQRYLGVNYVKVRAASEAMGISPKQQENEDTQSVDEVSHENEDTQSVDEVSHENEDTQSVSVDEVSDETLLAELIGRGYKVSTNLS